MSDRDRQLSDVEREFFAKFFVQLETAGLPAILLRNYENFPAMMGHDLDVFFRRKDLARAVGIFRQTLRGCNGELLHVHERDYVLAIWFRAARSEPQAIHLDFYHGAFTWHGLPYISEPKLIAASRPFGKFKIPCPAHEALNLFLTSLLWGGFFKSRYRERIQSLMKAPEESAEFFRLLKEKFGDHSPPPFDWSGDRAPDAKEIRRYAEQLRHSFKRYWRRRSFGMPFFHSARYWLKESATVISPPGICIAILGPDGSGKSTAIQAVKERLEYYFGEIEDRHWRPHFLGDIGIVLGKRRKTSEPVTDPHGRAQHSSWISALRFFYYWLDYWLGWPSRVWKFRAKNHLVIFDRYAQDMWCDPKRYRLKLPRGLMKFFCRLVPQPDLTFVLLADAEIIHRRKGEVPLDALRDLLEHYSAASKQGGETCAVDCSRPVDVVADEIAAKVLARLKTKLPRHRFFR